MALITQAAVVSPDTNSLVKASQVAGELYAGEDLLAAAPCRIDETDGMVYMSDGTAANAAAAVHGFTPRATNSGEAVTLYGPGARFRYAEGTLTPGDQLFLGATAGRLDDAATIGDSTGIAFAVDTNDIVVAAYKLIGA